MQFSHMLEGQLPEIGETFISLCGVEVERLPRTDKIEVVCLECVQVALTIAKERVDDLWQRMTEIRESFDTKDEIGQYSWINPTHLKVLEAIYWRPGPALAEGPVRENGEF